MKDWSPCHCKHMNSVIQKTSLTAWQIKMSPHTAKAEILWFLHLYYQNPLDFTEAKILWFKHKVTRVPLFYFHFLYFNRSTIEVSSYNSSPLYAKAQPVLKCACPSCRCQPLKQPVWHLQKCPWSAQGQPASILMQRGAQNWDVLPLSSEVCLLVSAPHTAARGLTLHSWV